MDMAPRFYYVGIRVKKLEQSIEFYTKLLKMKVIQRNKIKKTKGEIVVLTSENQKVSLELNYYEPDSPYNTPYVLGEGLDHLAFQVEDYDRFLEEADQLGFPKVHEVTTEHGRWAYIEDPNGIWIEINQQEN